MPSVPMLSAFPKRKVGRRAEPRTKPMLASTDVNDMSALRILFAVCSPLKWVIFEVVGHGLNGQVHCTVYFLFCHETLPSIPCHIYIYGHPPPPKIYTRIFHTIPRGCFSTLDTTYICRKHRKWRYNGAFRHVHANSAATSRGIDMCINLAPNLGQRFMIVYVLEKLKCWRACYFCSCSTTKPRVFA